ncbi:MAG: hypothetical protein ACLQJR_19150 [Stellaceae bacterium]
MSTKRSFLRHPYRARLTADQEMDLWLGSGPQGDPQQFAGAAARRAAWLLHRDRLAGVLPSSPGRRAQAWWQYEAPIPWPGYEAERSALYAAGLLSEEERTVLETEWRHEFERGCDPGFTLSLGPDEHLTGAAARRALYRWADIPRQLVRQWTAERKRAAQTIHELEASATGCR